MRKTLVSWGYIGEERLGIKQQLEGFFEVRRCDIGYEPRNELGTVGSKYSVACGGRAANSLKDGLGDVKSMCH